MTDRRTVTPDCERPARQDGTCFYCHQPVGGQHDESCVAYEKRVRVRAVIEYEIDIPYSWGKTALEFQRNEGSWCASNMLPELEGLTKSGGCLCPHVTFEYLGDVQ